MRKRGVVFLVFGGVAYRKGGLGRGVRAVPNKHRYYCKQEDYLV